MTGSWRHRNKPLCFTTYLKFPLWPNNSFPSKKLLIKIHTSKRRYIIQRKQCVRITPGINTRTFWRIRCVRSSEVGKRTTDDPREEEVAVECAVSHSEGHRCWHALSLPHSNGIVCTRALCTSICSDVKHENRTLIDSTPSVLPQVTWGKRTVVDAATRHLVVEADVQNFLKRKRTQKTDPIGHTV